MFRKYTLENQLRDMSWMIKMEELENWSGDNKKVSLVRTPMLRAHLYYYRRVVFTILGISSRGGAIRQRSWRRFSAPTCCQSATFVRPLFAFY